MADQNGILKDILDPEFEHLLLESLLSEPVFEIADSVVFLEDHVRFVCLDDNFP